MREACKLETVKQELGRINIIASGGTELKWTGMKHFQESDYYKVFYSGNDKLRINGVALI